MSNFRNRLPMKFNIPQLNKIIVALLNNSYNKKFASNVARLFLLFTADSYRNDRNKEVRYYLIRQLTEFILSHSNISTKENVLEYIELEGRYYDECLTVLDELKNADIDSGELDILDKMISQQLKYSSIEEHADGLIELLENLKSENFNDLEEHINTMETAFDSISRDLKQSKESIEDAKKDISLSSSGFINVLDDIIMKERNPANKVRTGIQFLNRMLSGGFEKQRVYVACGVAKGWKSGFLLNAASWAKRYNNFVTSDPNLKPVIVYLSMENSNEETIKRLWAHCFGNDSNIADYNKVEVARMFEEAKLFTPNDPNSPELLVWYRSNRSISTADLNIMLEDLKTQGKECCFLVLDYLRRIRPAEANKDLRLELSNVTNELKTIATEHDIPILTAHQLKY